MKILLATDGSRYARAAARFLARFMPGAGKHVDVIGVTPATPTSLRKHHGRMRELEAQWRHEANGWVDQTARTLESRGFEVRTIVRSGQAARTVVDRTAEQDYDLVVVGAKGRGATPFFGVGSVALAVLEHVPASVLLVRESVPPREKQVTRAIRPLRVLVPTDGKPHSLAAVDRFGELFREPHLDVRIVSAIDPAAAEALELPGSDQAGVLRSQLERAARLRVHDVVNRMAPYGIAAASSVLAGRPADAVIAEAASMNADMIVLGSRGVRPAQERRMGSVALEIARAAPCSVLVVRDT
jgi:nucleotide-binding universal stress UspA family protein